MSWITSLLSRGGPQSKKTAYLMVVVCGCFCLVWHGVRHGIGVEWLGALAALLGATTTGYLGGKKIGLAGPVSGMGSVETPNLQGSGNVTDPGDSPEDLKPGGTCE